MHIAQTSLTASWWKSNQFQRRNWQQGELKIVFCENTSFVIHLFDGKIAIHNINIQNIKTYVLNKASSTLDF
jgi:hypothetical protein